MSSKDIINEIKNKKLSVIIYGVGIVAKALLEVCKNEGIAVECFCDGSPKKAQSKFCDMEIIFAPDLKSKYQNPVFIIAANSIKDVVGLLRDLGYSNWYAGGLLLKDADISKIQFEVPFDQAKYVIDACILIHNDYLHPEKLFLRSIDIIITERCSLKCRDCSNLTQYYEKPQNCEINMLLKSIDVFCSIIDEVLEFRVLGGDAFMNPEWPIVTKRLIDEPKAKTVVIYTNGNIVPDEKALSVIKNNKARVVITDYGPLSRNLTKLKQALESNNIIYYVINMPGWFDCGTITPHNRSIEEQKKLFKICCAKNMANLSDGKLYRCPYAANALRLSAVPDYKDDYIDLFQEPLDAENISKTKTKIKKYLLEKEYMETCDFCNGRPVWAPEIPPAIQTKNPLPYRKHTAGENKKL